MLIDLHIDFESRSHADLKDVGPINYAFHESTQATVITWCFGRTGVVKVWRIGMPFPQDLIDVFANPHKYNINAFNLQFGHCRPHSLGINPINSLGPPWSLALPYMSKSTPYRLTCQLIRLIPR